MESSSRYSARLLRNLSAGVILFGLVLLAPEARAQGVTLAQAKEAYQFADYQKAVDLFSEIAQDSSRDPKTRQNAFRYLGRTYVARNRTKKARGAISKMLKIEPPNVDLNPDVEPPPVMDIYYQARKDKAGDYRINQQGPGLQTLAIMDFTNSSVDENNRYQPLQKGFPSMMINYMNGATDLKVIERERIHWLLSELKLQKKADVVDQSTAVRMGKLMGANAVVFGSYTVQDDQMWLSARMVKVETGEVLLAEQIFGDKDEFFKLIKKLSLKVSKAINVTLEDTKLGSEDETKSLDAMMSYSDGLTLLEKGKYRAAYEKFLEAKEYDPSYKRAKIKAQSIKPMLAIADAGNIERTDKK